MALDTIQPAKQLRIEDLPRRQVGHDPNHWINQTGQIERDIADDLGLTSGIEASFAEGKTQNEVQRHLGNKLNFIPQEARPAFLNSVRATLGIASRSTQDGEAGFQTWQAGRGQRPSGDPDPGPANRPASASPAQLASAQTPPVTRYDHISQLRAELTAAGPGERATIQDELDKVLEHEPELAAAIAAHDPTRNTAGAGEPAEHTELQGHLPASERAQERGTLNRPSAGNRAPSILDSKAFAAEPDLAFAETRPPDEIQHGGGAPVPPTQQQPAVSAPGTKSADSKKGPQTKPDNPDEYSRHISLSGPGGALVDILAAVTRKPQKTTPPWDGPPANLKERHAVYEQKQQTLRDAKTIEAAETAANTALIALKAYNNGPGAAILERIDDSAKRDPGGLQGVLSEMRQGGRYEDLRQSFNAALATEAGLAGAYERAAGALKAYEGARGGISQILPAKNNTKLTAHFNELDAKLAGEAIKIPGPQDGKSALDELGEKTREMLKRAFGAIGNAVRIGPRAEQESRPSPGPSP